MNQPRARLAAVAVAVICVLAATAVMRISDDPYDYVPSATVVGRAAPLDGGELTVTAVRVGTRISPGDRDDPELTTPGLFVVLDVRAEADRESLVITSAELTSGDHRYQPFRSVTVSAPPGFRATGAAIFEVNPDRIDDLTATLGRAEVVGGLPARVRVPLGITATNAAAWRASAAGRLLEVPTYASAEPAG